MKQNNKLILELHLKSVNKASKDFKIQASNCKVIQPHKKLQT